MFKARQKDLIPEDVAFLRKYHKREFEANEKKYTDWQLERAFIIGCLFGSLLIVASYETFNILEDSRNTNKQVELDVRRNYNV